MTRKLLAVFVVVCLCVMIYPQFGMIATANSTANFPVDVLLDYGNGTRTWSTCILSTPGYDTAFNATQVAADTLNYTVSEYGVFVNAINGVWGNSTHWWSLFFWNFTSGNWTSSPVGADQLVLSEGGMITWFYDDHPWPPLPPANPPVTQVEVMLNYGNDTVNWHNVSLTGASNAFKATQIAAVTLNYTVSEYGVFVNAINGVWGNSTHWWSLFFWNFTSGNWTSSPVGAIDLVLSIGDMVAWVYGAHSWPPVPPIRGDSDGDGDIDYEDIVSFVDAYIAYTGQGVLDLEHREGDMDNDGDIDYDDITSFVDAYIAYWSQGN